MANVVILLTTVMLLIAKKDSLVIEPQTMVAPGCDNGLLGNKPLKVHFPDKSISVQL